MIISGFNKLTLLDYPGHLAAIIFTSGCNYKCAYCQNSCLINFDKESLISEEEVIDYLQKRNKMIEGLVISGGEPTVQKDLVSFIKKVKSLGLKVKLDTNGSNPTILKKLIEKKLVDYIAMDIKNDFKKYDEVIKCKPNIDNIKESIKLIKTSGIVHEFRTTLIKNNHNIEDIKEICEYLGCKEKYYLQNFKDSELVLDKSLRGYSIDELNNLENELLEKYPNVKVRGI